MVNEKSKRANTYFVVIAALLVVLGLLLPSERIAVALVGRSAPNYNEVAAGTMLFRLGLGLLGLAAFIIWALTCLIPGTRLMSAVKFLSSDDDAEKEQKASHWGLLVVILTVAGVLRVPGLNSGLWYDEIATLVEFVRLPLNQLIANYGDQNNHPLFSFLARLSIDLFGESAWSLRVPALLFGLLSLWALFLLAQLVTDRREAFLATVLMAVSYHHVWFSQNARGYTGQLFWCLLGTWLFIKGYKKNQPAIWISYALSMALGMYTHLTTVFMLISHFMIYIFLLAKQRMIRRNLTVPILWPTIAFVLVVLFTFQLYALILPQVVNSFQVQVGGGRVEKWTNPIWAMIEVIRGLQMGFGTFVAGGIAVIIFLFGVLSFARSQRIVIALFVIPIMMGTTALLMLHRHFYPRFFFFELGIGILLLIRGCTVLGSFVAARTVRGVSGGHLKYLLGNALVGIIILASLVSLKNNYRCPKQDYSGAMAYIEKNRNDNDQVLVVGLARYPFEHYYVNDWETVETVEELEKIRSSNEQTWLIYTFQDHMRSFYPEILSAIEREFVVAKQFPGTVGGGTVYVCKAGGTKVTQNRIVSF